MMKYCRILLAAIVTLLLFNGDTYAQGQTKLPKLHLESAVSLALLNGSKGASPAVQAMLGGMYNGSYLGLGAGLDYYRFRSVPVFLHLSQSISKKTRGLLVYGDLGYNIDWVTKRNRDQAGIELSSNFGGGVYYDAGIGYRIAVSKTDALLLSMGYSFKKLTRKGADIMCPFIGPCLGKPETYDYSLRRLVIKAGWWF